MTRKNQGSVRSNEKAISRLCMIHERPPCLLQPTRKESVLGFSNFLLGSLGNNEWHETYTLCGPLARYTQEACAQKWNAYELDCCVVMSLEYIPKHKVRLRNP